MVELLIVVLGLMAGSCATAIVGRLHDGRALFWARSSCDSCKQSLAWIDLIPLLSWLFSLGACRYCRRSIGWYYPLVEIVSGSLFLLFYAFWPFGFGLTGSLLLAGWLLSLTMMLILTIYDLRWLLLPNRIVYPAIVLAILMLFVHWLAGHDLHWLSLAGSVLIAGGIFYVIFQISDKYIGGGDVKLGFWLGLLLADWQLAFLTIFGGSFLGVLVMLPGWLATRRKGRHRDAVLPFGPFLMLAAVLSLWFGHDLIAWYVDLL